MSVIVEETEVNLNKRVLSYKKAGMYLRVVEVEREKERGRKVWRAAVIVGVRRERGRMEGERESWESRKQCGATLQSEF
jgi:hypothetical protein